MRTGAESGVRPHIFMRRARPQGTPVATGAEGCRAARRLPPTSHCLEGKSGTNPSWIASPRSIQPLPVARAQGEATTVDR